MKDSDDYKNLERAHAAAGLHMMQTSTRADELIACLEGEIAKRDAELCERTEEVEHALADLNNALAELAAIKAQEPVAWINNETLDERVKAKFGSYYLAPVRSDEDNTPLYAAPVSEAKAQGVVMPERWNVPRPMWKDARQPYGNPLNHADIEAAEKFNLALDEVARLNAAPAAPAADAGMVEALLHHIEALVHDSRVPNEVSQECAAVLLTARYAHRAAPAPGGE